MSSKEYSENTGEGLNKLRKENQKCDVLFQIGERTFPAHRLVLISKLDFFARIFNVEQKPIVNLDPTIVSPDIFENILNFIYTSELELTEENLELFCVAANYFSYEKLLKKIENFIESNLRIDNVSEFLQMAIKIGLKSFEEKCRSFIVNNSSNEILRRDLISWFSLENLERILKKFQEYSEYEDMFHFAAEWVELVELERKSKFPEILKRIPLTNLDMTFLIY